MCIRDSHQGTAIAVEAAKHVDEVRVNPGLFVFKRHGTRSENVGTGSNSQPTDFRGEQGNEIDRLRAEMAYGKDEWAEELAAVEESFVPVIEACKKHDRA